VMIYFARPRPHIIFHVHIIRVDDFAWLKQYGFSGFPAPLNCRFSWQIKSAANKAVVVAPSNRLCILKTKDINRVDDFPPGFKIRNISSQTVVIRSGGICSSTEMEKITSKDSSGSRELVPPRSPGMNAVCLRASMASSNCHSS
jgi:hypothetical protein